MTARIILSVYSGLLLFCLATDLIVLLPLRSVGTLAGFYGPLSADRVFWIVALVALWMLLSVIVTIALVFRMGSRRTWQFNYPSSLWRLIRSAMLITSVICLGAVVPGYVVGTPPVAGDSVEVTERTWELWSSVLLVGVFAFLTLAVMYLVGAVMSLLEALNGRNHTKVASGGPRAGR